MADIAGRLLDTLGGDYAFGSFVTDSD